ncbi:hypothetical protein Q7P35_008002 [Cladosporium inversicolor]
MTGFGTSKILLLAMVASLACGLPTTPHVNRSNGYDGLITLCSLTYLLSTALKRCEKARRARYFNGRMIYATSTDVIPPNLNSQVQSARPFQGSCVLYRAHSCLGEGTPPITFPGIDNFEASGRALRYKGMGEDTADDVEVSKIVSLRHLMCHGLHYLALVEYPLIRLVLFGFASTPLEDKRP